MDRNDAGAEGGTAQQSDGEIHFKGALESDMGMKYSVHVELEADQGANAIDETYVRVSGDFGQLEIGGRDHAMVRMHYGISDVGIGLTAGDTQKWVPGSYLDTYGHAIGNARKLNYISPRMNGIQVGVSYAPDDSSQAPTTAPTGNNDAGWGAAVNFQQEVADMMVKLSLGYRSADTAGTEFMLKSGMESTTDTMRYPLTVAEVTAHKAAITAAGGDAPTAAQAAAGLDSANAIHMARDLTVTRGDVATYTNAGIGVAMGPWGFNVAWAEQDGGAYMSVENPIVVNANANGGNHMFDDDGDPDTAEKLESATLNDPDNDIARESVVKDGSKDHSVVGVSVTYTDGPMALSLGHMMHEDDASGERTATMLSGSYTLGPGVAWKTSLFRVEDTTSHANVDGGVNEGAAIVTGITLNF